MLKVEASQVENSPSTIISFSLNIKKSKVLSGMVEKLINEAYNDETDLILNQEEYMLLMALSVKLEQPEIKQYIVS